MLGGSASPSPSPPGRGKTRAAPNARSVNGGWRGDAILERDLPRLVGPPPPSPSPKGRGHTAAAPAEPRIISSSPSPAGRGNAGAAPKARRAHGREAEGATLREISSWGGTGEHKQPKQATPRRTAMLSDAVIKRSLPCQWGRPHPRPLPEGEGLAAYTHEIVEPRAGACRSHCYA